MTELLFRDHVGAIEAGRFLRVVNYHNTPHWHAADYEREFAAYARAFAPVTVEDLDFLFETGFWPYDRPGILPVFYEGLRNNAETAAPILDVLGLVGWFFVPTAFLSIPVPEQAVYAGANTIGLIGEDEFPDGRFAMTWDQLAKLGGRHVIAAHTANHSRAGSIVTDEDVEREVVEPTRAIEDAVGGAPEVFAWLGGESFGMHPAADAALLENGYRYVFSNTKIQRIAPCSTAGA